MQEDNTRSSSEINPFRLAFELSFLCILRWGVFLTTAIYLSSSQLFGIEFSLYWGSFVGIAFLLLGGACGFVYAITQAFSIKLHRSLLVGWLWRSALTLAVLFLAGGLAQGATKRILDLVFGFQVDTRLWNSIALAVALLGAAIQGLSLGYLQSVIRNTSIRDRAIWISYVTVSWLVGSGLSIIFLFPGTYSSDRLHLPPLLSYSIFGAILLFFLVVERVLLKMVPDQVKPSLM